MLPYRIETKIPPIDINIYMRRWKLNQKLIEIDKRVLSDHWEWEQGTQNIDWSILDKPQIDNLIKEELITRISNSPQWKDKEYIKILKRQSEPWKMQQYLKWGSSTLILKFRVFSNFLNRYSYIYHHSEQNEEQKLCHMCRKYIEDIHHFLWDCPSYNKPRLSLQRSLKQYNITFENFSNDENTYLLLSLVNTKEIYEIIIFHIKEMIKIRANRGIIPLQINK